MEVGEGAATPEADKPTLGALRVEVVSRGKRTPIEMADVTVDGDRTASTGEDGAIEFAKLTEGACEVHAIRRYSLYDYIQFVRHYPTSTTSHKAIGEARDSATIIAGQKTTHVLPIALYERLPGVRIFRNHIIWIPRSRHDDKYGHWWTQIDADTYGWWPRWPVGHPNNYRRTRPVAPTPLPPSAGLRGRIQHRFAMIAHTAAVALFKLKENAIVHTFRGVEGELNGTTYFGGRSRRAGHGANLDPHTRKKDRGNERYDVVITDDEDPDALKSAMRSFAEGYGGTWSWRFEAGQNCHTFQRAMLDAAGIRKFKKV